MSDEPKIVVTANGPYRVSGAIPLRVETIEVNEHGNGIAWKIGPALSDAARYSLCACGKSDAKPFCDGSHLARTAPAQTAGGAPPVPEPVIYEGPTLRLRDDVHLCAFARFCDAVNIWKAMPHSDDPQVRQIVVREALNCPSGRLVLFEKATGKEICDEAPPSIGLVEDPAIGCSGPLFVRGHVSIERADGSRFQTGSRVTLCRCGATRNFPFCDGRHSEIGFKDGLAVSAART